VDVYLFELMAIEDAAAECLSRHKESRGLTDLTSLSDAAAESHCGARDLSNDLNNLPGTLTEILTYCIAGEIWICWYTIIGV
jgi:hypothetical protein